MLSRIGGMVPQVIQPRLHDIVYEMAPTAKPIPLKRGVESLGDIAPTVGDDCREVHIQLESFTLLLCKPSNDYA